MSKDEMILQKLRERLQARVLVRARKENLFLRITLIASITYGLLFTIALSIIS